MDIGEILAQIEPPETSITLCVKGSLAAEYERLSAQVEDASVQSLAGAPHALAAADRMAELREQMKAYEHEFRLRALPAEEFRRLRKRSPEKTPQITDDDHETAYHAWVCEVVARSCVDPAMTTDQAAALADRLSDGQWRRLNGAAWSVNAETLGIPFSAAAYVLTQTFGGKSKPPEASASDGPDSSAAPPVPAPSFSETAPATSLAG